MQSSSRKNIGWLNIIAMVIAVIAVAVGGWTNRAYADVAPPDVVVKLSATPEVVSPGTSTKLRVLFTIAPSKHIYASDPGEIGMPTAVEWTLPAGVTLGEEKWSPSEVLEQDGFTCNVFHGEAALEIDLAVADTVAVGQSLPIKAKASWLVCDEMCTPGEAEIETAVQVAANVSVANAPAANAPVATVSVANAPVATVSAPNATASNVSAPDASSAATVNNIGTAILLAFGGGLILNLMPCVFPVLSIKALELVHTSQAERSVQRSRAWAYSAGIIVSFWIIAALLNGLRAAGQQLGWGFQMQSPYFVIGVAFVFVALALNMLGFYEIGLALTRFGDDGSGSRSSFASGVLAVVVATPCTAPFMGTALGYALTVPWYENALVFTALGIGLALPLVILALWPAWQRLLPRPGAWMVTLRQALAFPLLLTAVYFAWVVDVQAGPYITALMLVGWVLLGSAVWIYGRWGQKNRWSCWSATILALLGLSVAWGGYYYQHQRTIDIGELSAQRYAESGLQARPWSPEAVQEALESGKPVFVDFGASWCLTCQVNERTVLGSERVKQAMREKGVVVLKADWTNYDERITKALESFGRSGVPLYVYYNGDPDGEPQILPELLTVETVVERIRNS